MHGTGDELIRSVIQALLQDLTRDVNHTVIKANDAIDGIDDMREGGAR